MEKHLVLSIKKGDLHKERLKAYDELESMRTSNSLLYVEEITRLQKILFKKYY